MGKEIDIDFDTLFWSSNSWNSMYLYITNFKSRIYKATRQKLQQKKCILQKRLLASPTAQVFACFMVINTEIDEEHTKCLDLYDYQNRYVTSKVLISSAVDLYLSSSIIREQYHETKNLDHSDVFLVILIFFVLEPEFNARQDKAPNFVNIQTPKFAITTIGSLIQNQKQSLQSINLMPYLSKLSLNYVLTKLNLSNETSCMLKKYVKKVFNLEINRPSNLQRLLKFNSLSCQLSNTVLKFLTYLLLSEASYIVSSLTLSGNLRGKSLKFVTVINYGYEIVVYHKSQAHLKLWHQVFSKIINSDTINPNGDKMLDTSLSNSFNFLGYYFVINKNTLISIEPNKDSQVFLFRKIDILFTKFKSNAAVSLINSINHLLKEWGEYFRETRANKVFAIVDYLIYLKIRSWIFRNHPSWGRTKIISKYFVENNKCFNSSKSQTHRLFYTKQIVDGQQVDCMLIRLKDLRQ